MPVERVSDARPGDDSWRANALVGSRHSRWVDELRKPLDLHDRERAQEICGQVSRLVLRDFAPALLLLPRTDRHRLQAMTAYALTLFDFARQTGLAGESLTAINRWEFDLEATLDGQPPGQPVYVLIHALDQQRPWAREGFDHLHACARHRCMRTRPPDRRAAEREALHLGKSLAWLALDEEPTEPVAGFASALVRLHGLLDLGDDLRRHRARLPLSELPDSWIAGEEEDPQTLAAVIQSECRRLESLLEPRKPGAQMPRDLRAAARYSRRTARALLKQVQSAGVRVVETPPQMGLLSRLGLLMGSRWL